MSRRSALVARPAPGGPPAPASAGLARHLVWLAWLSIAVGVLVITVPWPMGSPDTFIQMAMGRYLWTQGFPAVDPFAYTAPLQPALEQEWLACIVFYLVFTHGGVLGLVALKTMLVSGTVGLVVATGRRLGASWGVLTITCPALLYMLAWRVVERPHLFTWLGLAAYGYLLVRVRGGSLRPVWLWLLVPLHILWVNLHGGWVLGLALVGLWAGGDVLQAVRARVCGARSPMPLAGTTLRTLVGVALALPVAGLVNPYGLALLAYPFRQVANPITMAVITEWQPVAAATFHLPVFVMFLGMLATLWGVGVLGDREWSRMQRRVWLGGLAVLLLLIGGLCVMPPPAVLAQPARAHRTLIELGLDPPALPALREAIRTVAAAGLLPHQVVLGWALTGLLAWWMGSALRTWRTMDIPQTAIVLLVTALAFRYCRAMAEASLLVWPLLGSTVTMLCARRAVRWSLRERRVLVMGCVLLLCASGYILRWGLPMTWYGSHRPLGWGMDGHLNPVCATAFVQRHGLTGRALVSQHPGALLLWVQPGVQVNQDTRDYVYAPHALLTFVALTYEERVLAAFLQEHQPAFILMEHTALPVRQYGFLVRQGWRFVFFDNRHFIMVPADSRPDLPGYAHILPWDNLPVTPATAGQVLDEAERALLACPSHATFAWAYKAEALRLLGRHEESKAARVNVPRQLWIE
jgi:hypothetical protein